MGDKIDWGSVRKRVEDAMRRTEEALMPPPRRASQILKERARALATPAVGVAISPAAYLQLLSFTLRESTYHVESRFVREVVKAAIVTPVPKAPSHLIGVINGRGTLLPVFDLLVALGSPGAPQPPTRLLVLGRSDPDLAIAVDMAEPPVMIAREAIAKTPAGPDQRSRMLLGLTSIGESVFDGGALLDEPAFRFQ